MVAWYVCVYMRVSFVAQLQAEGTVMTEGALQPLIDRQKMHTKKTLEQNEVITADWDIY